MIARAWHGAVPLSLADAYHEFLLRVGIPDCRATPGNLGAQVMRRVEGQAAHFLVLTFWESTDAIRAFAGDDIDRSRYYSEDPDFLIEMESTVQHFEVLDRID